ncbi:MAG: catecholate siderophore receptor Fiu [Rhodanobacter sp.]
MSPITSKKHPIKPATPPTLPGALTAALVGSLALALPAYAADLHGPHDSNETLITQAKTLPQVRVQGYAGPDYRIDQLSSSKFTQPLLDTTQTVNIIGRDLIQQQGATTLTEALRNSPGVGTFYAGENGVTSTGDAIYMRGFDSSGSIFIDGVRDLGSISRDVFNVEQIEITKGPDGTEYGRTAPTGAINMVSKQPLQGDGVSGTVSYGSAQQRRTTADWNQAISGTAAFRLNVIGQKSGVPGRDDVKNNRWGVAPSLAFGLGTPTRVYLDFLHVKQDNTPDGGVSTIGLPGYSSPDPTRPFLANAAPVNPRNFYGTQQDHDHVQADMFTAIVQHDFSDNVALHDTLRWGRTQQDYLLTSFMANAANLQTPNPTAPSTWTVARSNPNFKNQTNRIITNQTNLTANFTTGAITHNLSTGIELTQEKATATSMAALAGSSWPAANLYRPAVSVGGLRYGATGAYTSGTTDTVAAYVFDTLKFGEHWQINAGARLDHYRTDYNSAAVCGGRNGPACGALPTGTAVPYINTRVADNLPNYKLGVLYKPTANGSIYANFALAQEPPGGDTLTFSSSGKSQNNPDLDPQQARTVELGTKWSLLNDKLLLTGALYRTTVNNQREQDQTDPTQYYQIGKKRVQGVEINAVGRLTENWALSTGYTIMNTKVLGGNAVTADGTSVLAYTPKSAFTAWTTYHLPFDLTLGGGGRYSGELHRGTDGALGTPTYTEAYWVFDAVASYPINKRFSLQLNVYNLFDKHYVASINKSGYRYIPGAPRSAMLTANINF